MQSKKAVFFLLLMIVIVGLGTFVKSKFFKEPKVEATPVINEVIESGSLVLENKENHTSQVNCYLDAIKRAELSKEQAIELCKQNK